jgi:hypothetical protein
MAVKDLPIDQDFEADVGITKKSATTRAWVAATGLTGVTARFALTKTGAAVGSSSWSLSEAGSTGRYFGVLDTATMVTDLAAYANQTVYLIVSKSGDFDRVFGEYVVRRASAM